MPDADLRRARQTLGAVAVGAALVAWWPSFTLGAWGQVFFEQVLTLWAAATAAFVIVVLREGSRRLHRTLAASLLLPSVWIVLEFLPVDDGSVLSEAISWFGVAITVLGLPLMTWVILQVARPDVTGLISRRTWVVAGAAVATVAVLAFTLGRAHPHFLTCEDFTISGNSPPATCTPGPSSLSPEPLAPGPPG